MKAFLSTRKYPALLTLLSIFILVAGMLLKPQKATTEAIISESESRRLQQLAQKRSVEEMAAFFARVAADAGAHVIYAREADASGILWNNRGDVVTSGRSDSLVGTVRLTDASPLEVATPVSTAMTSRGSWVVQVARNSDGSLFFTPGIYRGRREASCMDARYREIDTSIELTPAMAGGGLFDLEGRLLGVIAACGNRMIALQASEVEQALHPRIDSARAVERKWGMNLAPLDAADQQYFRVDTGLLVKGVREHGPAERSGLAPGDVVVSVEEEPVDSVDGFQKVALASSEGVKVGLIRRHKKRIVSLTAAAASGSAPSAVPGGIGLRLENAGEGIAIEDVAEDSPSARAGIRPGDRLLQVNGARVRRAGDLALLLKNGGSSARYLIVKRGDRRLGILVP